MRTIYGASLYLHVPLGFSPSDCHHIAASMPHIPSSPLFEVEKRCDTFVFHLGIDVSLPYPYFRSVLTSSGHTAQDQTKGFDPGLLSMCIDGEPYRAFRGVTPCGFRCSWGIPFHPGHRVPYTRMAIGLTRRSSARCSMREYSKPHTPWLSNHPQPRCWACSTTAHLYLRRTCIVS